jgi:hypothetical protein
MPRTSTIFKAVISLWFNYIWTNQSGSGELVVGQLEMSGTTNGITSLKNYQGHLETK